MPSIHRALLGAAAFALALAALPAGAAERGPLRRAATPATADVDARVIVRFKADSARMRAQAATPDAVPRHAQALSMALGLALADGSAIDSRTQSMSAKGLSSAELMARLAQHPDVEAVSENKRRRILAAPNDPYYRDNLSIVTPVVGQWYLRNATTVTVAAINGEQAWGVSQGSAGVVVAVLDTGVRLDHPDLAGKLLPGYDFLSADSDGSFTTAADGNGRDADPTDPGDYDRTNAASSSSWHGTQTAGLVGAATDNGAGIASIGRNVKVLPVRVLGVDGGTDGDILAGMRWAAGLAVPGVPNNPNPAKVINMSLGAPGTCQASYRDLIAQLAAMGVVVVASAGNDGLAVNEPANCAGAVGVGGVRHTGTKVGYSSLGPEVAVSAPAGNCVNVAANEPCLYPLMTTWNRGTREPTSNAYSDSFDASIGTSFSSPLVAGTVGLMLSADPTLTPAEVKAVLQATSYPFPTTGAGAGVFACTAPTSVPQESECYCTTSTCGAGLLDAGAALEAILASVGVVANIGVETASPTPGAEVSLTAAPTALVAGSAGIVSYAWSLVDGGGIVSSFTSATNASTVTLMPSAAGAFVVRLSLVDTAGRSSSTLRSVSVGGGVTPPPPLGNGGDSGGGALGLAWLMLLAAGTVAAARSRRG